MGNILPKHRSAFWHIHLMILLKHMDLKNVLETLIVRDCKRLQLDFEGFWNYCIKGDMTTVPADNLISYALASLAVHSVMVVYADFVCDYIRL